MCKSFCKPLLQMQHHRTVEEGAFRRITFSFRSTVAIMNGAVNVENNIVNERIKESTELLLYNIIIALRQSD